MLQNAFNMILQLQERLNLERPGVTAFSLQTSFHLLVGLDSLRAKVCRIQNEVKRVICHCCFGSLNCGRKTRVNVISVLLILDSRSVLVRLNRIER